MVTNFVHEEANFAWKDVVSGGSLYQMRGLTNQVQHATLST